MTDWTPGGTTPTSTWDECADAPDSTWTPCAGAVPVIHTLSPSTGVQHSTVALTVHGGTFSPAAVVAISGAGITVQNIVVVNPGTITCDLVLALSAAVGARQVTVIDVGGTSGPAAFTVTQATPVLTSVTPNTGTAESAVPVALVGDNFIAGATVQVSGAGVVVSAVVVVDAQHITAVFTIDVAAAQTARNVTVTVP